MASKSIVVRKPVQEDVKAMADLVARLKLLNEELDPHYKTTEDLYQASEDYIREALEDSDSIILVAVDEETGQLVGLVKVDIRNRLFYEPRVKGVITDLYVHPSYRRKKLGVLLIDKIIEELRNRGVKMITAIYPVNNVIATRFYENLGFTDLDVEVYKEI
ncbi:MAG: GNAT family N-acetyltransferase [Desulfurococcales archaeon]|nr:GNAT family N-acetyltransferase [Desulfurococcales archaeon]